MKIKKIIKASILALSMTLFLGMSVFAGSKNPETERPATNKIFINNEGTREIVISVNEDGSFVTAPLDLTRAVNPNTCKHTDTQIYGNPKTESQSYNMKYSDKCYKTRTVYNTRCVSCGKTGLKTYSAWIDHKHQYPLLSSTCKKCGYKK